MTTAAQRRSRLHEQQKSPIIPAMRDDLVYWADKLGWHFDETFHGTDYRMRFWRRKDERMEIIWRDHAQQAAESWFESPEVARIAVLSPDDIATILRTRVPVFEFAEMDDAAVLKWLRGKEISWINVYSGATDKAVVPGSGNVYISHTRNGRRLITFADPSFRSAGLDAITEIR